MSMLGYWGLLGLAGAAHGSEPAQAELPDFEVVQVVFLDKGPQWTAEPSAELEALQAAHRAHLKAMWQAGQAEVCGPVEDPSGDLRGLCIYTSAKPDIARTWAEQDPAVKAGHLSVRVLPWYVHAGRLAFPASTKGDPHAGHGHGDAHGAKHGEGHGDDATVHHRFNDVDKWTQIFDDPARDEWQKPAAVVEALTLSKGMVVADIGAGTGYFNPHLAAAVGKKGRVVAIDVERSLVDHMVARAEDDGTPQVVPRLGRFEDPGLLPGEVDRILIVDTYHHIDDRKQYFSQLRDALKEGGQMVVVDFKPGPQPVGPPPGHKIAPEQVMGELETAGWQLVARQDVLPHQYVLVFAPLSLPDQ